MNKYAEKSQRPYILMALYFAGWAVLCGLTFLSDGGLLAPEPSARYMLIGYSFLLLVLSSACYRFYAWYFRYYRWWFGRFYNNAENVEPKGSYFAYARVVRHIIVIVSYGLLLAMFI